jgi:3-oxoacyl-[acyl-carrier protein] reductase
MKTTSSSTAIVFGGTGNIGVGIVREFLRHGLTVVVPSRSEQKAHALREYVADINTDLLAGSLVVEQVSTSELSSTVRFVEGVVGRFGGVDVAVASLGGWWSGPPLTSIDEAAWHKVMQDNITAHFIAARAALPAMMRREKGTFVSIAGPGNVMYLPQSSLMKIMGSAQMTMAEIFAKEAAAASVRYHQLFIANILTRERAPKDTHKEGWITPEDVGAEIMRLHERKDANEPMIQKLIPREIPGFVV